MRSRAGPGPRAVYRLPDGDLKSIFSTRHFISQPEVIISNRFFNNRGHYSLAPDLRYNVFNAWDMNMIKITYAHMTVM